MVDENTKKIRIVRRVVTRHEGGKPSEEDPAKYSRTILIVVGIAILVQLGFYGRNQMLHLRDEISQAALRKKFNVTTVDNFLDHDFSVITRNDTLWRACDTITASGSTRFWYYPGKAPNNIFEEMVVKIYKDTPYWDQAKSFEYWCNIMETQGKAWPWHTDRDEDILETERKLVFPLMGAVYYGYTDDPHEGGDFFMIDSIPYRKDSKDPQPNDECDETMCISNAHLFGAQDSDVALRVPTKFNRLLFANVSHFHTVTPLLKGKRYAFVVNANHWLPYTVKQGPTDNGMIEMAKETIQRSPRTFGLA